MLFGPGKLSGYNFTERVRKVLTLAREEAARLQHEYVGTEHILLGLIREGEGVAAEVLRSLRVDTDQLRRKVERTVKKGKAVSAPGPDLPYTSRAKKVLELAMAEVRELDHSYAGTEHLLLGLIREEKGIAAQLLFDAGVSLDIARAEAVRLLGMRSRGATAQSVDVVGAARPAELLVRIDDGSTHSIYEQIVAQIQEAVATGRVAPGDRLPTVRQLADELDIAPGTVARAYAELERLGVVVTEGARGTRVSRRRTPGISADDRPDTLVGLLRPVTVAAFHLGATAGELRAALEKAMADIFGPGERDAA